MVVLRIHEKVGSRRFSNMPSAKALASPVRKCPITGAALPNFFLQRFALVAHPETKKPWFLPRDLETKAPVNHQTVEAQAQEGASHPGHESTEASPLETAQQTPKYTGTGQIEPTPGTRSIQKPGPSAYTLSSQRLLQELQHEKSPYSKLYKKLLRMSDHGNTKLGSLITTATWRHDMDIVVLELLRRRVVEGLCHFSKISEKADRRKYILKCESWDEVKDLKHRGCLLYLGTPNMMSSEPTSGYVPPRLATMDLGPVRYGSKLAVHNLCELLGEEHVAHLRQESELPREGSLYLLGRQATVNLQMILWKLQGYMVWKQGQQQDMPKKVVQKD
ncbi:hypothetical protein C7999DRAFT_12386 [Corynascus novoguineensis]|uniref:Uncharacterized protein n=1 Tax=Corynascus novoguineensis TaxID=1126955 RepID=A0AAN7CWS0_9PEZI|nr:hypothetical protein C7999DRAFT_12386 [Corynascus novoguineensis]